MPLLGGLKAGLLRGVEAGVGGRQGRAELIEQALGLGADAVERAPFARGLASALALARRRA